MFRKLSAVGLGIIFLAVLFPCFAFADPTLTWTASGNDVSGYIIYYGKTTNSYPYNKNVGNVTQYPLMNLPLDEGEKYYFIVKAYNEGGLSDNSNEVSWTIPDSTPPMPPSAVSCQNGGSRLTWQANTENDIDKYRVYCGSSSGNYGPFLPAGNVTSYTVQGLNVGEKYYFAVSAVDHSGNESGLSTEVSSTITQTDTISPSVAISAPISSGTYETTVSHVTLSGNASDNTGVEEVQWWVLGSGGGKATGTVNWEVSNLALSEGENLITIKAIDYAGNTTSRSITVAYTVPAEPVDPPVASTPTIKRIRPTTSKYYFTRKSSMKISGWASDDSGIKKVEWSNSKGGSGEADGKSRWSASGIKLDGGWNVITITVTNNIGNTAVENLNVICWAF